MDWVQIRHNWNEASDKIKLTWGKLSEDDITAIAGQRDQFGRLLQQRHGTEQKSAESAVDRFAQRLDIRAEALASAPVASDTN